jgi:hypothetical protein
MDKTDHILKSLDMFKDWSNYLLVTTVAALGWLGSKDWPQIPNLARKVAMFFFCVSIISGIFTLALIPLIAEQITDGTTSFYDITPTCSPFLVRSVTIPIKAVCWPQHASFLLGIIVFTCANIFYRKREVISRLTD